MSKLSSMRITSSRLSRTCCFVDVNFRYVATDQKNHCNLFAYLRSMASSLIPTAKVRIFCRIFCNALPGDGDTRDAVKPARKQKATGESDSSSFPKLLRSEVCLCFVNAFVMVAYVFINVCNIVVADEFPSL